MKMKKKRVVVAMSGGVDSSVAAALLKGEGYEVIGITMCFNLADSARKKPSCCGTQGIEDARSVARKLGIPHYVVNMQKNLEEYVVKDFCDEYAKGRTPNPCVRCNQYLKFGDLLRKARLLDARYLATGHYARIVKYQKSNIKNQIYLLQKAKDRVKDQSYFLYRLGQEQLKYILFPLGDYTKDQVRNLAREFKLPTAEKVASQEICFLPQADYRDFLAGRINAKVHPGPVVDKDGRVLGEHKGIAFYTIGQREGLGIAAGYPLHIIHIDAQNNKIIVGKKEEVYAQRFLVKEVHFVRRPSKKKIAARVRIRYNHTEALAQLLPLDKGIVVCFRKPQFAVTPGQSAVFYDGDRVLGGGIIAKVLNFAYDIRRRRLRNPRLLI